MRRVLSLDSSDPIPIIRITPPTTRTTTAKTPTIFSIASRILVRVSLKLPVPPVSRLLASLTPAVTPPPLQLKSLPPKIDGSASAQGAGPAIAICEE